MDELNVLMPEEREIKLSFGTFIIKPLGIKQIIKIVTFSKPIFLEFMKVAKEHQGKEKEEKQTESEQLAGNMDFAFKLVELAGDKITDFISIILKTPEPLTIDDIPLPDMLIIINAVLDVNDIPLIQKSFFQAMEKVIKEIKTAKKK